VHPPPFARRLTPAALCAGGRGDSAFGFSALCAQRVGSFGRRTHAPLGAERVGSFGRRTHAPLGAERVGGFGRRTQALKLQ